MEEFIKGREVLVLSGLPTTRIESAARCETQIVVNEKCSLSSKATSVSWQRQGRTVWSSLCVVVVVDVVCVTETRLSAAHLAARRKCPNTQLTSQRSLFTEEKFLEWCSEKYAGSYFTSNYRVADICFVPQQNKIIKMIKITYPEGT